MRLALVVQGQEGVTWPEWVALADACEQSGVEALLRSDHYLGTVDPSTGVLDAWATICALAAVTDRVRLGTLVSPVTFRHPSVLAKMAMSADQISDGRVEVGVGGGWHEGEHQAFGFPLPPVRERMAMLERQLEVLHLQSDPQAFPPGPVQRPHPPIIVGGNGGPRTVALAARWADEYNSPNLTAEEAGRLRTQLDTAARAIGREPIALSIMLGVIVAETESTVELRRRRAGANVARAPTMPARILVSGTPDQVAARLLGYRAAGVSRVVLGMVLRDELDQIALLGQAVAPVLANQADALPDMPGSG